VPRRRDRQPPTSVFGSVTNAEAVALSVATMTVGPLTERERKVSIALAHFWAGRVLDLESWNSELAEQNEMLTVRLLECVRLWG
jgi:hypothetical protein